MNTSGPTNVKQFVLHVIILFIYLQIYVLYYGIYVNVIN
jgi:hypothetical protein